MNLADYFKSKENDPKVLENEKIKKFKFVGVFDLMGVETGCFYGYIEGPFGLFISKHYRINKDGYEVFKYQNGEMMDGLWVNFGQPELHIGRKIF